MTEGGILPHTPVLPSIRANARRMRKAMTNTELKLWNELQAHRLMGLSFRRQMPVAGYIGDFACAGHRLIVELNGSQHANAENASHDEFRRRRIEQDDRGVLRFWNDDVLTDTDGTCTHILRATGKDVL